MALRSLSRALLQRATGAEELAGLADQLVSRGAAACTAARGLAARLSTTASAYHGGGGAVTGETIAVTFTDEKDGSVQTVRAPVGESLLEVAHRFEVELEGACEGSLACSTCHVIVEDQDYFDRLPEADDDENDMLDLAFGLTDTSRLGCQIKCTPELEGLRVRIPSATRNFGVDGYVAKPH